MLRRLALWLLHFIEGQLDPDLQARLDQYSKRKAEVEAQVKEAQAAISGLEGELTQLNTLRAAIQDQLAEAEREGDRLEAARRRILNEDNVASGLSDHDVLRDRL